MTFYGRFIFPAIFGWLMYLSIRLVTDIPARDYFWDRPLLQNAVEIGGTMLLGYLSVAALHLAIRIFDREAHRFSLSRVGAEFGSILFMAVLLINPLLYGIHYLARDPLEWADITIANIIVLLYVLLYYAIVRGNRLFKAYVHQYMQTERLKIEQLQTELKFLKAQYHPHFLFNALNTIYFQMDEDTGAAKKTVERFSQLLRYQLYDQHQLVTMDQEINHLHNFISLQKERSSDKLAVRVTFDSVLHREQIFPLLLLPLVENAFKYVGGDFRITIQGVLEDGWFVFRVTNSLPAFQTRATGGIGLENVQRRLELLYPGRHAFHKQQVPNLFEAELKIQLT